MKYRTIIELICDAANSEDAANTSGEYLRGNVDFGVAMKCRTESCCSYKAKKYAIVCAAVLFLFSPVIVKVAAFNANGKSSGVLGDCFRSTYTVTPQLKTKDIHDFKTKWEKKKDEAVLNYIKN